VGSPERLAEASTNPLENTSLLANGDCKALLDFRDVIVRTKDMYIQTDDSECSVSRQECTQLSLQRRNSHPGVYNNHN
jgi:hypothetical protein